MKKAPCDALMPILTSDSLVKFYHILPILSEASFFLGKSNNMHFRGGAYALSAVTYFNHSQSFSFLGYVLSIVNGLIAQKVRHT